MSKTKILVTGGAGNIGSVTVEKLISDKTNFVVVADNLSTGFLNKLPKENKGNWTFVKSDVNIYQDIAQIMLAHQFDYVFHFAAVVGVKRTQENPISVLRDIDGIKNILELSKNTSVKRVFYASSSEVYGEPVSLPQHEHTTPLNSRVPYAVVKNLGECFCKSYHQEYGLNYTIYRYFNTYGPNQSTDFVLPRFLEAALKNKDITIYGDGSQTRTFTYVDDTIDASLACLFKNEVVNDVINIGNDISISMLDLAKLIIKKTKSQSKIIHFNPLKEGDMTRRQPDNTKMRQLLNRSLISLEEGIERMLNSKQFLSSVNL
ncbi:MAG TPA: NAD-dependent epimerase/dehydratase family protein [Bacteroidia bacterium]|jgi:nucleoside-diphosphate-sugar epimerase|nr:NAD-dependent epimerase/dehydratase family protein [Bacteroidia bacterium]